MIMEEKKQNESDSSSQSPSLCGVLSPDRKDIRNNTLVEQKTLPSSSESTKGASPDQLPATSSTCKSPTREGLKSFDNTEICIRDGSSVAVSECTKPDPPCVFDSTIQDDDDNNDDDDDDENDLDEHEVRDELLLFNLKTTPIRYSRSDDYFELLVTNAQSSESLIRFDEVNPNNVQSTDTIDETKIISVPSLDGSNHRDKGIEQKWISVVEQDHVMVDSSGSEKRNSLLPDGVRASQHEGGFQAIQKSKPTRLEPTAKHSDLLRSDEKKKNLIQIANHEKNAVSDAEYNTTDPIDVGMENTNHTNSEQFSGADSNVIFIPPEPSRLNRSYVADDPSPSSPISEYKITQTPIQPQTTPPLGQENQYYLQFSEHRGSFGYTHAPSTVSSPHVTTPPIISLMRSNGVSHHQGMIARIPAPIRSDSVHSSYGGRRKITLRLEEDVQGLQPKDKSTSFRNGILGHIRKTSSSMMIFGGRKGAGSLTSFDFEDVAKDAKVPTPYPSISRGKIAVSWFEGTSSIELHEHVRRCIVRKLVRTQGVSNSIELQDLRILDESADPPEEIVLSPFIPDGSNFVCRFGVHDPSNKDESSIPADEYSVGRAPSPETIQSPNPQRELFGGLNANQIALISSKINAPLGTSSKKLTRNRIVKRTPEKELDKSLVDIQGFEQNSKMLEKDVNQSIVDQERKEGYNVDGNDSDDTSKSPSEDGEDDTMLHSEDPIETRFREIFQLLLTERRKNQRENVKKDKRQVIFIVSNYLVLFLAVVAVCAEIQARLPNWLKMVESQLESVHSCGATQEALFECVSRGDFAGLLASIGLWLSRSVATHRIFLFGFESPKKLWTVVYEALVSAVCWGISHLFIRRGLNPDTRENFIQKYWKDTVYGALAGFNAAFLKQVLKNLIPEEAVEDALRERHIKILKFLPSFWR